MSGSCSVGNILPLVAALAVVGCAPEQSAAERRAADDRAIAQVRAAQEVNPPPRPLSPQPILFADIQRYKLFGAGCAFAPGTSMGAVLLTRAKVAFVKLDERLVRFASDPGSAKLPMDTFSHYLGKEWSISLTRLDANADPERWNGKLTITDPYDQVVYSAEGSVQCSA